MQTRKIDTKFFFFFVGLLVGRIEKPQLSSDNSGLLESKYPPTHNNYTIFKEAQARLLEAYKDCWKADPSGQYFMQRKGRTVDRYFLDTFVDEVSVQLNEHPMKDSNCMDWASRYVTNFEGFCKSVYNYQYAPDNQRNITLATKGKMGEIFGDLGSDMSHVPDRMFDLILCTQVFEHVPHWWIAMRNLADLVKPKGIVLFTAPSAYYTHHDPGDFWRFMLQGSMHALESAGLTPCAVASSGLMGIQLHVLGLTSINVDRNFLTKQQDNFALQKMASSYGIVAQKTRDGVCDEFLVNMKLTNSLTINGIKEFHKGWWPDPMKNFPCGDSCNWTS